jgi:hypothetical protein
METPSIKNLQKISNKTCNFILNETEYSLRIDLKKQDIEFTLIKLDSFTFYLAKQSLLNLKIQYLFTKEKSVEDLFNSINIKIRTLDFTLEIISPDKVKLILLGQVNNKQYTALIELTNTKLEESHLHDIAENLQLDSKLKDQQIKYFEKKLQDLETNYQSLDMSYQELLDQHHYMKNELQEAKALLEQYKLRETQEMTQTNSSKGFSSLSEPAVDRLYLDSMDSLPFKGKIKSKIIEDDDFFLIEKWVGRPIRAELIFSTDYHGDSAGKFHLRCDGIWPSVAIIETENGRKFGGFTVLPISSVEGYLKGDGNDFIFSIDNKRRYRNTDIRYSFFCTPYGMVAYGKGNDLYIHDKCCSNKQSYSNMPVSYGADVKGEINQYELAGSYNFKVKTLELFKIVYLD